MKHRNRLIERKRHLSAKRVTWKQKWLVLNTEPEWPGVYKGPVFPKGYGLITFEIVPRYFQENIHISQLLTNIERDRNIEASLNKEVSLLKLVKKTSSEV